MNEFVQKIKEKSMYYERGHGAFGEPEKWLTLDEDKFVENIVIAVFNAIDDSRFEIPEDVVDAVVQKFGVADNDK